MREWVPCDERLPEKDGEYLCQRNSIYCDMMEVCRFSNNLFKIDDYDFYEYRREKKKGFYGYSGEWGYYEINDVIAWMPLPDPYVRGGVADET